MKLITRHNINLIANISFRYVKEKRPSISPNFNFMGQLLEYEARLREEHHLCPSSSFSSINPTPLPIQMSEEKVCVSSLVYLVCF